MDKKRSNKIANATNKFGLFFNNKAHRYARTMLKNRIDIVAMEWRAYCGVGMAESYRAAEKTIQEEGESDD